MKTLSYNILLALLCGILAQCSSQDDAPQSQAAPSHFPAFDYLEIRGNDEIFEATPEAGEFQNPVLTGFYPDPTVTKVGNEYYLTNSTFGYYPGLPIFKSSNLVDWVQIGNAIDRPDMVSFDGLSLNSRGLYAPAIEHNNGTFYIINTCVGCGHNFIITATDPAGPWSDPIWLDYLPGIDPSLFFDDDGRTYIVHHGDPPNKRDFNHTGIFIIEIDAETFQPISDDVLLVDGGEKQTWNTIWVEGPHLYKVDGEYLLSFAGGGTGLNHQQIVYKGKSPMGPYTPYPNSPILTQFDLPEERPNPVTSTGHADLVQDHDGNWWALFLGIRPYQLDPEPKKKQYFHTGRETFMLPVEWKNGWPHILERGAAVPNILPAPAARTADTASKPASKNDPVVFDFTGKQLAPNWLFIRIPEEQTWSLETDGFLSLSPNEFKLGEGGSPSFVSQRVRHLSSAMTTRLNLPKSKGVEAGLALVQNDEHYFAFGVQLTADNETLLRIRKRSKTDEPASGQVIAERIIDPSDSDFIQLTAVLDKGKISFLYDLNSEEQFTLLGGEDSKILSSSVAGGFTGAVVGLFAETVDAAEE